MTENNSEAERMKQSVLAQLALPSNVIEIITRLSKLEEKIDRNHETINEKLDRVIRMIATNET